MLIQNAGHTLGNLFQWILTNDSRVKYAAYKITHPLFNTMELEYETFKPEDHRIVIEDANKRVKEIVASIDFFQ